LQCQLIQGPDAAVDDQSAVADVEVVELEAADGAGAGGVDGREGEDQSVRRPGRHGDRGLEVAGVEGLDDAVLLLADPDAAGRVLEGGEILRRDSGKLLGDGHGNQYPGGVHPFFEHPVRHKIFARAEFRER
jgi:hypothetical protein